ncbi:ATP-binding protein [Ancylomarina euxinus]|uniref:ATP-binding protein n=1 Tax=Ancylomarina euxinus TaxID=2283627 RepID=UPI000F621D74|nr:ATP-binding protein [Ancylomarina euxinus]MCZ4695264.1 ATP-binding protein [Ancylomarina euxinus]MUP15461.1 response regulator [Ancylomarina euxinus]
MIKYCLMKRFLIVLIYVLLATHYVDGQEVVRIGAFNHYPAIFKDVDGEIKGFYVDALREIELKENLKFIYVFGSWNEGLERIKNEEIDIMVSVAYTEERATYMDYCSSPLLTVWGEVYVDDSSDIDGIQDLQDKRIAVMKEDINAWCIKDLIRKFSIDCTFVEEDDFDQVFNLVASSKVDAGVVNNTFGAGKSREYGLRSSGIVFHPFDIFFTVKKNTHPDLLELLNNSLQDWKYKSTSVFNTSRQKWSHGKVDSIQVSPSWLKETTVLVIIVLILLILFIVLLRFKISVATRKVKKSEEKLSRALIAAPFPIMIHAEDGEVISINETWTELTGYSLEDIPTFSDWKERAFRQERPNGKRHIDELYLFNSKMEEGEYKVFTSWGEKVVWDFISAPLGSFEDGRKLIISIAKDVTERKLNEVELIQAKEKAEKSDALKSAFLANMSHEIRTPMNGILGFADLLKEPQLNSEEQQKYIQIIEKSGVRMLNIINDIIDISKIESGLMEMNIKESNINKQIEYIYTFFKPEVEAKNMRFTFNTPLPLEEAIIKTDREKLFAVLTNLVKNAIKYSEKGFIDIGYVKTGKHMEFYVKDTGIGIEKDRQQAIFKRFVQADISDKEARQGAGLGLAISKAYVEMLGGKFWVESEIDKGSTFYFTVPCELELKETTIASTELADGELDSQIRNLNILVAEDNEESALLLSILLKRNCDKISYVKNGYEAVEFCHNNPDVDMVFMDVKMPQMDGYEATQKLRQFNKDIVIISQTAFGLAGDKEKAIEAGCNGYISKPINKRELMILIERYFGHKKELHSELVEND